MGKVAVAITTAVLLLGSAFPVVKFGLRQYQPGPFALLRFLAASLTLALFVVLGRIELPPRRELARVIGIGVLVVPAYHMLFNIGLRTVSASAASVLVNTGPIWTALMAAAALGERPAPRIWMGLGVGFIGVLLIAYGEGGTLRLAPGALLIVGAAVVQAASFVLQKPLVSRHGAIAVTASSMWAGTLILLLFFATDLLREARLAGPGATIAAVYTGVACSAIGLGAWAYVLGRLPASTAAPFLLLVPVAATALAKPLLGELPRTLTLLGGAVALVGVLHGQGFFGRLIMRR